MLLKYPIYSILVLYSLMIEKFINRILSDLDFISVYKFDNDNSIILIGKEIKTLK